MLPSAACIIKTFISSTVKSILLCATGELKFLGMEILDGLRYDAQKKEWVNGKIYDASSGRYWSSCAKLLQNGILKVRGFWKVEWIGKSISFKKVA
jgi:uncharacterized protein (DUF2147 family)